MASESYKGHLLIWNAEHDKNKDRWIPDIIISWPLSGRYQFHRFKGPLQDTAREAVTLGKHLAEAWVDKKL
jgi:hypothetical protein